MYEALERHTIDNNDIEMYAKTLPRDQYSMTKSFGLPSTKMFIPFSCSAYRVVCAALHNVHTCECVFVHLLVDFVSAFVTLQFIHRCIKRTKLIFLSRILTTRVVY